MSGTQRFRRIRVVVNPAAGHDEAVLAVLNDAFSPSGVDWDVAVTHGSGDARRIARRLVADKADVVAAYGGDGTVMEVAGALIDGDVPLAILPGGTANVLASDLGVPPALADAASLLVEPHRLSGLDVGKSGRRHFVLRLSAGLEAEMDIGASRERKDAVGVLAYPLSALEAAVSMTTSHYRLTLDGQRVETEGVTCIVANSGALGVGGLTLAPDIDVADGQLDVIVLRDVDVRTVLTVAAGVIAGKPPSKEPLQRWKARSIRVEADPPQRVACDGEPNGSTPFRAEVMPSAVRVVLPPLPD